MSSVVVIFNWYPSMSAKLAFSNMSTVANLSRSLYDTSIRDAAYFIWSMIARVNSEVLALPPRSPVRYFPSAMTPRTELCMQKVCSLSIARLRASQLF